MVRKFFRSSPARPGNLRLVINDLYRNATPNVSAGFSFDDEVLKAALMRIYSQDFNPITQIEENLFREFWDKLNEATDRGIGNSGVFIDPDDDFHNALRYNNGVFAAFKTHRTQNDMAAQLLDENGELKPFEQWLNDVQTIADHQCRQWFQTEYDTAIKRAHQAAEWKQFEREADVLPNLEWIKSMSITPGEDHRIFWGIIRPINDPSWNEHKPGDRWGCKCSLRATDKEPTPASEIPTGDKADKPAPGLDNNPGKDAQLFSDTHPYIAGAHKGAKAAVNTFMADKTPETLKYTTYKKYKNGGEVLIHPDVNKKGSDYKQLITIANQFAKEGKSVKLTPSVHFKSEEYSQIYGSLLNTPYYRKCPDLKIGDYFYEFESYVPPFKKDKISHMLNKGFKQSDRIIINNSKGSSDRFIKRLIHERINRKINIEEVWLYEKGKTRLLYKKQ